MVFRAPLLWVDDASYRAMLRFGVQYEIGTSCKLEKIFH